MKVPLNKLIIPAILFVVIFGVYLSNLHFDYTRDVKKQSYRRLLPSEDAIPNSFLPFLIIKEHTLDFSPVYEDLRSVFRTGGEPYFLIDVGDKLYSVYPIATAVFALPLEAIPLLLNKIPNVFMLENIQKMLAMGRVIGSFYASITSILMYFIFSKLSKNKAWAITYTIFFALGTTTWSISSRGLWMHTISQLLISLSIFLLLEAIKKPHFIKWVGLILGLAVLVRPTNIIFAVVMFFYVYKEQKRNLIPFIYMALISAFFMFLYNKLVFGSFLMEGYRARGDLDWNTPLYESLAGFFFSPGRSFLFLSPPLIFGFIGMYKNFVKDIKKKSETEKLLTFLTIGFAGSFFMICKWWAWAGANGFGYRMLTDYLPIISIFALLVTQEFKKIGKVIVVILMAYSIYIHGNAVIFRKSRCDNKHNWTMYCLMPPSRAPKY